MINLIFTAMSKQNKIRVAIPSSGCPSFEKFRKH